MFEHDLTKKNVEKYRAQFRSTIPPDYDGYSHFIKINVVGFSITLISILCLYEYAISSLDSEADLFRRLLAFFGVVTSPRSIITFTITFLLANFIEYMLHRDALHHKVKKTRHSEVHHRFYTNKFMAFDDFRVDVTAIFFPAMFGVFMFGVMGPIIFVVLYILFDFMVACVFLGTGAFYYLSYEWLHLMYHSPIGDSFFLRNIPFFRYLQRHHLVYHSHPLL